MKRNFVTSISLLATILTVLAAMPALAANSSEMAAKGDEYWPLRAEVEQAALGADFYRLALEMDETNFEAAWKLSRNLCWVAEHTTGNRRLQAAAGAVDAAKRAMELQPDHPASHFYLALSQGYWGHARGVFQSLFLITPIEKHFHRVIELDPGFEKGAAWTALGRGYFFLPGYLDKSIEYFLQALKYGPDVYGTHLFLAEAYMKKGDKEKARRHLQAIFDGPPRPDQLPEYEEWVGEAEYLTHKLDEMD